MEEINNELHNAILDSFSKKRKEWEKNRKPYSVLFELTARCNFNCIHCYLCDHHSDSDQLNYNEVVNVIDILYDMGIIFLTFTGGDVFVRNDFLDIYLYAKRKGFFVEIFTNGELITDEAISTFKRYPPLLIDITLYGSNENMYRLITGRTGAFEKVISVCNNLKQNDIRFTLKTPVMRQTVDDIVNMKKIADGFGVQFAYSYELVPTIDGDESVRRCQLDSMTMLEKEFSDFNRLTEGEKNIALSREYNYAVDGGMEHPLFICNVARNSFFIDYRGNICPCMKLRHRGVKLQRDNYKTVWSDFAKYGQMKASKNYKCSTCEARFQCSSCPAEMDALYGDYECVNPNMCKVAKSRFAFYDERKPINEALTLLEE